MNYPANTFKFRQDSNFLYLFGLDYPNLAGIIDIDNNTDIIFGNDIDINDIIWMGQQPSISEKAQLCGVTNTQPFTKVAEYLAEAIKKGRNIHYLPPYRAENKILLESLLGIKADSVINYASTNLVEAIVNLRSIKDTGEIEEMKKAAAIGYEMQLRAMQMAFPDMSEQKIAGTIEGIALSSGKQTSFPIILSQNGQILHNHSHNQILQSGRLMVCDCGAETLMNYTSDHTRTVPVGGKFTTRQREIYEIVLAANNTAIYTAKPGLTYREVHLSACKTIVEGLINLGIMKGDAQEAVNAGAHALFMPHGLGHMIGLDVHDMEDLGQRLVGFDKNTQPSDQFGLASLRMGRTLQTGFTVTDEPGIYFISALIDLWKKENKHKQFLEYNIIETYKDFGGIRLEDMLLITETGCQIIGKRPPITVNEVESEMAAARMFIDKIE
jgi:Xaa-Pro aminopeptidase